MSYKAPYLDNNLLHFADSWVTVDWRDNGPFYDRLRVDSMRAGRSAKYVILKNEAGNEFPMFIIDLVNMLKSSQVYFGSVAGWWKVRKRGQNFGVTLTQPPR